MAAPFHASPGLYATGLLASVGAAEIGRAYDHGLFEMLGWGLAAGFAIATLAETGRRVQKLYTYHQARRGDDVFGSADFASRREIRKAGLLGTTSADGIFLGEVNGELLFYPPKTPMLTLSPSGGGKTSRIVVPNVLHAAALAEKGEELRGGLVTGKQGEISSMCFRFVKERMPKSAVINPGELYGLPNVQVNPLQSIIDLAAEGSRDIGLAALRKMRIVIKDNDVKGDNSFFKEKAQSFAAAVVMYLAIECPEECTLPDLHRLLSSGCLELLPLFKRMSESTAAEGAIARAAHDLQGMMVNSERTFQSVLGELTLSLAVFESYGTLAQSIRRTEFDFNDLKDGPAFLFIEIPEDMIDIWAPYVALLVDEAVHTLLSHRKTDRKVVFHLDEFQRLPVMPSIPAALYRGRSVGVLLHVIVQTLKALQIYKEHADAFRTQADIFQIFGTRDIQEAEFVETRTGQRTVDTANVSEPEGQAEGFQLSRGKQAAPRIRKDEVLMTDPETQFIVHRSNRVIRARTVPWWDVDPWRDWPDDNPMEGGAPPGRPRYRIRYRGRS